MLATTQCFVAWSRGRLIAKEIRNALSFGVMVEAAYHMQGVLPPGWREGIRSQEHYRNCGGFEEEGIPGS
jgi:hypothetical protein